MLIVKYPTYTIPLSWDVPIKNTGSLPKAFLHSVIAHDILLFKLGHLWHRLHRGFLHQISEPDLREYLESNSDYLLVYTVFSSSSRLPSPPLSPPSVSLIPPPPGVRLIPPSVSLIPPPPGVRLIPPRSLIPPPPGVPLIPPRSLILPSENFRSLLENER